MAHTRHIDSTSAKTEELSDEQSHTQFPGNEVRGPASIESALRFIAAAEALQVRELPDALTDHSKLVLVRRLIREGLLTIDPSAA